jgi:hypothetical protein
MKLSMGGKRHRSFKIKMRERIYLVFLLVMEVYLIYSEDQNYTDN